MKFLCVECDAQMEFTERRQPGDGTFAAAFRCPACGRHIAMLANPMESQLVGALGVKVGGRTLDEQPMEQTRISIAGAPGAFIDEAADGRSGPIGRPRWSAASLERLERVPSFVRGMVKKIYGEWAAEHGITEITPDAMDRARVELGLEGM
ncbi:MAG TPA: PCP reductase family protein [Gemmatimonadaceae bacterium]|nr:PCP reductase family protein [Gemmatimonadaceae bacterium]